jgi:hypothetical protein
LFDFARDYRKNKFHNATNEDTSLTTSTEPNLQDYFYELSQTQGNQCSQSATFMKTPQHLDNNDEIDHQLSLFEDLMDMIAHTPATTLSTSTQTEEPIKAIGKHQKKQLVSNCVCRRFRNITDYERLYY